MLICHNDQLKREDTLNRLWTATFVHYSNKLESKLYQECIYMAVPLKC